MPIKLPLRMARHTKLMPVVYEPKIIATLLFMCWPSPSDPNLRAHPTLCPAHQHKSCALPVPAPSGVCRPV